MRQSQDNLKPMSEAFYARQRRHQHNGLLGCVGMAKAGMRRICEADSTTAEAKAQAQAVPELLPQLEWELKMRVDKR